ncbi:MAG TPA: septum formation initiator [Alphaproteobacteria bacterium]|jgi:cell division protein FtsB|nr:septum formation initiator [Alphaproteobacteria bacterium]HBA43391.1 septum formation initiator [Alphaproteobacteria bacterium]HBC53702.1 septum formation initiator [Alphaproteobacteria bacterium]
MDVRYELRRRLRPALLPLICVCGIAYFIFHAVQGDHGVATFVRLDQENAALAQTYEMRLSEREALETRVAGLRPNSLDLDLLEERARALLGLAHPRDRLIYTE